MAPGHIGMSDPQRTCTGAELFKPVPVRAFDIFSQGSQAYLAAMDVEMRIAPSSRKRTDKPYDQDELAKGFIDVCLAAWIHGLAQKLICLNRCSKTRFWLRARKS